MKRPHGKIVRVETPEGPREAVAPVIVSASRSTDLPAFYGEWFARRFRAGWVRWVNPFNQASQWVSFERTRVIVFWSKNPRPLLERLEAFARVNWYLTFTVNDYLREGLEPTIPPLQERLDTFARFSDLVGPERVVWRADPLLLAGTLEVASLLSRIHEIGKSLRGLTRRLVFSFADIHGYRKVASNLAKAGIACREWDSASMLEAAKGLSEIGRDLGLEVVSCAEEINLSSVGIPHGRCIDGQLLHRLFPGDQDLQRFLGYGVGPSSCDDREKSGEATKDKGQRKACGCITSKDIGRYDTCPHGCLYCYANASPDLAKRKAATHDPNHDSIIP